MLNTSVTPYPSFLIHPKHFCFTYLFLKFLLEYSCLQYCVSLCCTAKWISYTYIHIHSFIFIIFWLFHRAYGILVPQSGIESVTPAVEAWSLNHWTIREGSVHSFLDYIPIWKYNSTQFLLNAHFYSILIIEYWVEFPVLYSMSLLVIYFTCSMYIWLLWWLSW